MTGRSYRAHGDEFALVDSEYADDTAVVFDSREETGVGVPDAMNHFDRFRMEVHRGDGQKKKTSKSEVLFCSKPLHMYTDRDTFDGTYLSDIELGNECYIPAVEKLCYIGCMVATDCSDTADVENRITRLEQHLELYESHSSLRQAYHLRPRVWATLS